MAALRLALLGALAVTARAQQCDCSPCEDYPLDEFKDPCFDKCIVTGDPHVEHSWRPGFEEGFDFQPQGIWRLAKTDTCGGTVEVQAFFCHYFFTPLSSAIAYAITINGGEKYIIKRVGEEFQVGSPDVRNMNFTFNTEQDPVAGRLLVSDDKCVRIKMNTVNLYGGTRVTKFLDNPYLNNIFMNIWGCATTESGICGAPKLSREFIDPESDENLFKTPEEPELWKDLCQFCQEEGEAITPPGCPAPPNGELPGAPGCEFLRPFGSLADKECVPQPNPDGDDQIRENNLRIKELQGDGENCVAFVRLNNGPKFPGRSCRDWCQDRGAECVDVRDDTGTGRFPDEKNTCQLSAADDDKNFEGEGADRVPKTCDTVVRDTHCVCKKPDNPAPGESVERTCADARDAAGFNFSYLDAADICREESMWFNRVTYPQNGEQPNAEQRLLLYCVQDVCATEPEDRPEIARSYGDRDPDLDNKPDQCNGPLLCNIVCSGRLIQDWGECVNRCEGHRSKLIHAVTHYCKAGICLSHLEETETIGLLQRRGNRSLETDSRRSWSSRSRRSWSSRSRRSWSSRSRRSRTGGDDDDGSSSRRRLSGGDDDDGSSSRRRLSGGDDDDGSSARRRLSGGDDDDGSSARRRLGGGDDDDGSSARRRLGGGDDDDGSSSRRRKGGDDDDDGKPRKPKCVDQKYMCDKLCDGLKLEGEELQWCKRRCAAKFSNRLKPALDHYCEACRHFIDPHPTPTTTTTTTSTTGNPQCPFVTTTTSHPPYPTTTRHPKGDDDDGSRRRKGGDDDDGGSRRRKGGDDDDGSSRRRKGGDDDGSSSRRRKGGDDDDGSSSRRRLSGGDDDDGSSSRRRRGGDDDDGSSRRRRGGDDDDGASRRRRRGGDDD